MAFDARLANVAIILEGEPCAVQGAALPIVGKFDDAYAETNETEGTNPTLTCLSADLPSGLVFGATVTRTATAKVYAVVNIRLDGMGCTALDLEYSSG